MQLLNVFKIWIAHSQNHSFSWKRLALRSAGDLKSNYPQCGDTLLLNKDNNLLLTMVNGFFFPLSLLFALRTTAVAVDAAAAADTTSHPQLLCTLVSSVTWAPSFSDCTRAQLATTHRCRRLKSSYASTRSLIRSVSVSRSTSSMLGRTPTALIWIW